MAYEFSFITRKKSGRVPLIRCARFTQQSLPESIDSLFSTLWLWTAHACSSFFLQCVNVHMQFISNVIISDFIAIRYTFFGWESCGNYRNIYFSFHISSLNKWFVSVFIASNFFPSARFYCSPFVDCCCWAHPNHISADATFKHVKSQSAWKYEKTHENSWNSLDQLIKLQHPFISLSFLFRSYSFTVQNLFFVLNNYVRDRAKCTLSHSHTHTRARERQLTH